MIAFPSRLLVPLAQWNPAPLFALSLLPYLVFLLWIRRVRAFPRLALLGFRVTLVFVAGTAVGSVVALTRYGAHLADVDVLHGSVEALLTISNVLVLAGFLGVRRAAAANRISPAEPEPGP